MLHGESGILVGLKRSSRKVFIIPEPSYNSSQKYSFQEISSFEEIEIFPQDVAIIANTLYVLDFYKGVFIYSIVHEGKVVPRSLIPFDSFGGNFQFKVYKNSVFINFNDV